MRYCYTQNMNVIPPTLTFLSFKGYAILQINKHNNISKCSYKNSSAPCGDDERACGVGNLVVETLQGGGGAERDSHLEDKEIIIRRGIEGRPPGEDREIMMMIRR